MATSLKGTSDVDCANGGEAEAEAGFRRELSGSVRLASVDNCGMAVMTGYRVRAGLDWLAVRLPT